MSPFSYSKSINNLEVSVSIFNNIFWLFSTSSFDLTISFISSFAANLNFISSSWLFSLLQYLLLSVPCFNSNSKSSDCMLLSCQVQVSEWIYTL